MTVWAPGGGRQRRAGPLHVRVLGSAQPVVLLLHGLAGAGNGFGAAYDQLSAAATVVVPDLLGFGESMEVTGPTDAHAHIAALDAAPAELGLRDRPTVVAGHSMGGVLAIRWAAAHSHKVRSVLTFGARRCTAIGSRPTRTSAPSGGWRPCSPGTDRCHVPPAPGCAATGRWPPGWPSATAPTSPCRWPGPGSSTPGGTYSGAMNGLIRNDGWLPALDALDRIPLTLAAGDCDPVPVAGRATELARIRPALRSVIYRQADHWLPFTDPDWCRRLIWEALERGGDLGPDPSVRGSGAGVLYGRRCPMEAG